MSTAPVAELPAAKCLALQCRNGKSGIVTITAGKVRRLFCLDSGHLVYAATNLIEEQFEELLVERGLVSPAHRAQLKIAASKAGRKLALHLADEAIVPRERLELAQREHVTSLLYAALEQPGSVGTFAEGRPDLDGDLTVALALPPLMMEHAQRYPESVDKVRVAIGPPSLRPQRTTQAESLLEGVSLDDVTRELLPRCDGKRDITTLIADASCGPEPVLRAILGLLHAGVVLGARETVATRGKSDAVGREEALARLKVAEGTDHYGVLGIDRRAPTEDVRRAYYALARRFHPDRFRSGELQDLLTRIEAFFSHVTEAYNTLIDGERRQAYDEELAERTAKPEQDPEQDPAYLARQNFAKARSLIGRNRFQEAVKFLRNAIQLDPGHPKYHRELGRVLGMNPRLRGEAEQELKRAIELAPTDPYGHLELGLILERAGRPDEAVSALREALSWDEGNPEALEALRRLGA